jgi:aryl-alcohol dehydrogenase-like predicted oxidoreductase
MENDPRKTASVDALLAVAGEAGATPSQAALAWLTSRGIIPIIGPRTGDQLMDNLGAVAWHSLPTNWPGWTPPAPSRWVSPSTSSRPLCRTSV